MDLIKKKKNSLFEWLESPSYELSVLNTDDSQPNTPIAAAKSKPAEQKPVVTKPPVLKASPKSFSIKDALEGKITAAPLQVSEDNPNEEESAEDIAETDLAEETDEILAQEDLERFWHQFVQTHLSDKPRFASLLTTYEPVVGANSQVKIVFESQLQLDMFLEIKNDLTHFLRAKLGNRSVAIDESFQSQSTGSGKIYTVEDRFKYLSQKNPKLLTLKQQLNLDFD